MGDAADSTHSGSGFRIREYSCIARVPGPDWDALVSAGDVQATREFVSVCEESRVENARYRHIVVSRDGAPMAIATLSRFPVRLDLLSRGVVRRAIGAVRAVRDGFLEASVVVCGLPVSFGQSLLRIHPEAGIHVLPLIHQAIERFAGESGAQIAVLKEFTDEEMTVLRPLAARGYRQLPSLPSCRLRIRWTSFDEYVASMRSGYRRQMLATLREAERRGLRVRAMGDWSEECSRIFPLYEEVIERAEFRLERLGKGFFAALARRLAGSSSALLVERNDDLLACAVLLHGSGKTTFLLAGVSYGDRDRALSYPFLLAEIVRESIRRGDSELEMGQTGYASKQRLGGHLVPRHLLLRGRGRVLGPVLRTGSSALFPEVRPPVRRVFRGAG